MRSLTGTEGVDVLIELEPHDCPIVVDDVGLTVPGTRHHLLSAVTLVSNHKSLFLKLYIKQKTSNMVGQIPKNLIKKILYINTH